MSRTSVTRELRGLIDVHGWDERQVNDVTDAARVAAFSA